MKRPFHGEEEGQIIPALLLFVVVLFFFGLLFAQVGSAAEQKTQTQTVADSAAVASVHDVRDAGVVLAARTMVSEYWFGAVFNLVPPLSLALPNTACSAAQRNWTSNPHQNNAQFDCGTMLTVAPSSGGMLTRGVHVEVLAPRDQVVHGPANDAGASDQVAPQRARATAEARVSLSRCPQGVFGVQKAMADWVADRTMTMMGAGLPGCLTPDERTLLTKLELNPVSIATIGPPQPMLTAVRNGLRAELVD